MFTMIESLEPIVQAPSPVFTQPSFQTHPRVFLGWIMCLGRRTEYGVFQTIEAETPISRNEKLSPWVWLMQSVVALWHFTEGCKPPQAEAARKRFGAWDTEWSLAHMLRVLRAAILGQTITTTSATQAHLEQLLDPLENYLSLAT